MDSSRSAYVVSISCWVLWLAATWVASMFSGLPLLVMPIAIFGGFLIFCPLRRTYWENPGLFLLVCVAAVRYVLIPSYLIFASIPGSSEFPLVSDRAVFLMMYEQTVVLLTLYWVLRNKYGRTGSGGHAELKPYEGQALWIVVAVAAVSTVVFPDVLGEYNLVVSSPSGSMATQSANGIHGAVQLVVAWGKMLLPLLLINALVKKTGTDSNATFVVSIVVLLLVNVAIFRGVDRQSALVPGVASLFYLLALFPRRKKWTVVTMVAGLLISFVLMTSIKADYVSPVGGGVDIVPTLSTVEAYFNGYSNLEVSLQALESYGRDYSAHTMANDILGNFPGARMDLSNRTTVFYNLVFYGGGPSRDQIVPLSGQALFYGGLAFMWIPMVLLVLLVAGFDRRYRAAGTTLDSFLYALAAVVVGMGFMLNVSIVAAHIYTLVLPGMVILRVSRSRSARLAVGNPDELTVRAG